MPSSATGGHDGPYSAPVVTRDQIVKPEWIDYNGHMNVAYYTLAIDHAVDEFLDETLGIGVPYVQRENQGPYALQAQYHYLNELMEGEAFHVCIRLLDHDAKRLHLFSEMVRNATGKLAATHETILMNVDLAVRRSAPYPGWVQARLAALASAHSALELPAQAGATMGLRKRG